LTQTLRNIVGRNMLCLFGHSAFFAMLGVLACCMKLAKLEKWSCSIHKMLHEKCLYHFPTWIVQPSLTASTIEWQTLLTSTQVTIEMSPRTVFLSELPSPRRLHYTIRTTDTPGFKPSTARNRPCHNTSQEGGQTLRNMLGPIIVAICCVQMSRLKDENWYFNSLISSL